MEDLTQLMEQLDLISKSIPEGNYLKMCNNLKNIHQDLRDVRRPRVAAPFMPVITIDDEYDGWAEDQAAIIYMAEQIKLKQKQVKLLKIRKNVTEVVKRDAIKERAQQLEIRLRCYTMDDLRAKGVRIPNERAFYKSYIDRQNILTQGARTDLELEIGELQDQIDDIEIDQSL
jgi:hypothetical protein|tara:strand:+ start:2002 stop:2520 length:519 start_codon:yes stop_codon:yes gene_type:complete